MLDRRALANAVRVLSMDAVQKANSGHPGMPMGMADIAEVLWNDFLQHNPTDPSWPNRDRFILSNGHGSMLQYALLHLTGYDLSIDDLKHFRQLNSKTPGHPEYMDTPGVETTTGPLGQGLANAVGMAIAEKTLAAQFNREDFPIMDHYTYVFAGDGCLMEGISHEVCSLAGTLGLGKLILFYDDNGISIDGEVRGWFTDDTPQRFAAYHWQVLPNVNGHDAKAIKQAIESARQVQDKPSIICLKTKIGFGAPNLAGSEKTHGAPLGEEEIRASKKALNWDAPDFEIPEDIYAAYNAREKGQKAQEKWQHLFNNYAKKYPEDAAELTRRLYHQLPAQFLKTARDYFQSCCQNPKDIATRKSSLQCIEAFAKDLPEFIGGSADLTGSNLTWWSNSKAITHDNANGNYLFYGVREFGMFAIMNGIALHGGFIPFGGTFLVFVDYGRNAVRMSAIMKQKVIFVLTHDSIGLGEDGPTHQPIEHAAMLRLTPGLAVWRPCDTAETVVAWANAIAHQGPTCLLLSRQNLKQQTRSEHHYSLIKKGGYILSDSEGAPDIILIATGSEVERAVAAAQELSQQGHAVRVVSMPSTTVFDQQDAAYKESVLPQAVQKRIAIEAAASDFWYKYVGLEGDIVGLPTFGKSAPAEQVYEALGITVANIVAKAQKLLSSRVLA